MSFLRQAEPQQIYDQLIEPIIWETGSKEASFVEESIKAKLILHGDRQIISPPLMPRKLLMHLLTEAWKVATQKENRELTRVRGFLKFSEAQVTQTISAQHWRHYQQMLAATKNSVEAQDSSEAHPILLFNLSLPYKLLIPPLYHDVVQRTDLLANIQAKLQSEESGCNPWRDRKRKDNPCKIDRK